MAEGQPAAELPSENLPAQYLANQRTGSLQLCADIGQPLGFQVKALTDAGSAIIFGEQVMIPPTSMLNMRNATFAMIEPAPQHNLRSNNS